MEELEKIAVSLQARNNKNYWGILKRLHGGSDRAIEAIQENKLNMYAMHGTSAPAARSIMKDGLKPGHRTSYGDGVYLGDKSTIGLYTAKKPGVVRLKTPSEATRDKVLLPKKETFKKFEIDDMRNKPIRPVFMTRNNSEFNLVDTDKIVRRADANKHIGGNLEAYGTFDGWSLAEASMGHMHTKESISPSMLVRMRVTKKLRGE